MHIYIYMYIHIYIYMYMYIYIYIYIMRIGGEATSRDEGHCKGDVCIGGCVCICVHKQYIPIKSLEEILRLRSKLRATGSTTCREDSLSQTKIQNNTQYIPMFKERERERELPPPRLAVIRSDPIATETTTTVTTTRTTYTGTTE